MADGFSFAGLKCILEYLEANKRIFIAARSPVLRDFEKSIPLRLDALTIDDRYIRINTLETSFTLCESTRDIPWERKRFKEESTNLTPGDIIITPKGADPEGTVPYCLIVFYGPKRYSECESPSGMKQHTGMRIMLDALLGGYPYISVGRMTFEECRSHILRVPSNFKLLTRDLVIVDGNISQFVPMIKTLPLKELRFRLHSLEDFNLDIVRTAEVLNIGGSTMPISPRDIYQLPHKHIRVFRLPGEGFFGLLDLWMQEGKEIGTTFEGNYNEPKENSIVDKLKKKIEFGSRPGMEGVQFHRSCIPITSDAEIHMFITESNKPYMRKLEVRISMKVAPAGSVIDWEMSNK